MVPGADGACCSYEGCAGEDAAEGDEGFFFEAAGEFLEAVFFVEIAVGDALLAQNSFDSLGLELGKLTYRHRMMTGEVCLTFLLYFWDGIGRSCELEKGRGELSSWGKW